jgi:hypothetical protein
VNDRESSHDTEDQSAQYDDDNPLIEMFKHQSEYTPDDIRDILSINKSKSNRNKPTTRSTNNHVTYNFSRANTSKLSQLVDRGANGGLAGGDMKILHKTGRKVNISGIDNHELTDLDVVTCACLLDTSKGRIVAVFHEYAYYGKGRSIHSPAQMEWFNIDVNDKSRARNGLQRILTLEGHVIPIDIISGLAYINTVGIPTDKDLEEYPTVFFTDPNEWDPTLMD